MKPCYQFQWMQKQLTFIKGGYNRVKVEAFDHDVCPDEIIISLSLFLF
jgi:hypothetical protein